MSSFCDLKKFIIVNNISGKGNALDFCYKKVLPKIARNISYIHKCAELSLSGHTIFVYPLKERLQDTDYDVIVILGGDGTVHQTINMLMGLKLDKPICHLPCGTGNGLSKSLHFKRFRNKYIHEPGTKFNIDIAISNMKEFNRNGNEGFDSEKLNIFSVNSSSTGNDNFYKYGFLSMTWGLFSDIDIKTEWLRRLGSIRNTLGAIWGLIRKHSYYGSFSYETKDGSWITISDWFYYFTASNVSHICEDVFINPDIEMDDGYFHIGFLRGNVSRWNMLKLLLSFDSGTCDKYLEVVKTKRFKLEVKSGIVVLDGEKINPKYRDFDVSMTDKQVDVF